MISAPSDADTVARVVGIGPGGLAAARLRLDALRRIEHAALCVPIDVELGPTGEVLARSARVGGVDLAGLARMREGLSAGECVTVGTSVAGALAALHAAGLVHGDVSPANIVVSDSRVMLVDLLAGAGADELGTPGFAAPERAVGATAASDVFSLGKVLASVASEEARERVTAWAAPMSAAAARDRPTALVCVRALEACAPPRPVRVPERGIAASVRAQARDPLAETVRRESGRPWRIRRAVVRVARIVATAAVAATVVAASTAVLGAWLGGPEESRPWPVPVSPAVFGPRPDDAAADLVQRRLDAVAAGDVDALLGTTGAASRAREADLPLAAALREGDVRYEGLSATVAGATVVASGNGVATLRVTYAASACVEVSGSRRDDLDGAIVDLEVELRWGPNGWRIDAVAPVA